jgi:hypothetical protein
MRVYYRGERVAFTERKEPIRKTTRPMPAPIRPIVARKAKPDHPWRQAYQSMKPRVPNPGIATPLVGMRTYASPQLKGFAPVRIPTRTPQHKKGTFLIS